uniref:MAGUK p55 subfamily member 4-like n=1 Tax=Sinocyclocheilus rhinocerous TaxID=307959 RepID=A0A673I8Q9_9TELE
MQPGHDDNGASLQIHRAVMLYLDMHKDVGLAQILTEVVEEVRLSIDRDINGADLLYSLLSAPWLYSLLRPLFSFHHRSSAVPQIMASVRGLAAPSSEAQELYILLKRPHMQEATIRKNEKTGNIFISRVIYGGLADRSGLLHPGDKLVEVNGQKVRGLQPEHVIQMLVQSQGNILFKVIPNTPQPTNSQPALYVRAMVNYSPLQDPAIPCPDAGMAFSKGDLPKIVDQRDIRWWQARKLHSASLCCGLIPSTNHKQRELWWSQPYQAHTCIRPCTLITYTHRSGFRHSLRVWRRKSYRKRKPSCYSCGVSSCHNTSATVYEEVVHYQRHIDDPPCLIVLIAPSGVGVNELRRRLIKINPNTYQGPISHTTRSQKMGEKNGREYHFVTKEVFAYMVVNHKFLEYGQHNGHMYGTSLDSVQDVLDNGKICVIDLEPHCIHSVRTKKLKPYIIYVRPPSPARMKQTRKDPHFLSNRYIKRYFYDKDFEEIEEASRTMEAKYRQYFDCVIVNDDLQDSCMDLFTAIQHAQEEPQWIPASWFAPDHP